MSGLHRACEPLAFLLGTWRGEGTGSYPTIEDFTYSEEVVFAHVGKPFLAYTQKTRDAAGAPLHAETGYLRIPNPQAGSVEMLVVQPSGIAESLEGTAVGTEVRLASVGVLGAATAKPVQATRRDFVLDDDGVLHVSLAMAAMGCEMTHHVASRLRRV